MSAQNRTFFLQIIFASIAFSIMSLVIKHMVRKDENAQLYLTMDKEANIMALTSSQLLDSLIAKDEVTMDPTSGKEIIKAFSKIKISTKPKLLMIGSSQLIVIEGKNIEFSYNKLVSDKIEYLVNNKIECYNFSLGGMTTNEKLIVAEKAIEMLAPERVLISATPWDCLSESIRPEVKKLKNSNFPNRGKEDKTEIKKRTFVFPLTINSAVTDFVEGTFTENIIAYNRRKGIKKWMQYKISNPLPKDETLKREKIDMPKNWETFDQFLDNKLGWDSLIAKKGKRSLKIVCKEPQSSKWVGEKIYLDEPIQSFQFEGWAKGHQISEDTKLTCFDVQLFFEDGTELWYYKDLKFKKGTYDWSKVISKVSFAKKVIAIKPHLLFYGGSGTIWFDDLAIRKVKKDGTLGQNVMVNPSFEKERARSLNVYYTFNDSEWMKITEKMISIIDFLSEKSVQKNIQTSLLLTPFWHTENKFAYPQIVRYKNLVDQTKKYCKSNKVIHINASFILSEEYFGRYINGPNQGKIDVLHFNEKGHMKLANYINDELGL